METFRGPHLVYTMELEVSATADEAGFDSFVAARSRTLLNAAWLLTGDRPLAEDLLQSALAKTYLAWRRIGSGGEEAYVRKVLFTTYVTWWRRAAFKERPAADATPLDLPEPADLQGEVVLRRVVLDALAVLPRGQRAAVVLRYYCDLSEAETAAALGCSVGAVKSQTSKALARLRTGGLAAAIREGSNR